MGGALSLGGKTPYVQRDAACEPQPPARGFSSARQLPVRAALVEARKLHTLTCLLCTEQYTPTEKKLQEGIVSIGELCYNEKDKRGGVR